MWREEGEDELGEFGYAGDGVEVGFAEGSDAHDAEEEGEGQAEDVEGEGDVLAEGDVCGDDAEDQGDWEEDGDGAGGDKMVGWCVVGHGVR